MQRRAAVLGASMLVLAMACQSNESPASGGATASGHTTAATTAAGQASGAATPTQSTPSGQSAAPVQVVRVGVRRTPELGAFLTDGNGRSLYLLEEDGGGESSCYEMCAAIWPPFLAGAAAPTPSDSAVQQRLLGSIPRRGGGAQVTYAGQPLYYYLGDAAPGQTRGQHVEDSWGEWYLVSPNGRHVGEGEDGGRRAGGRGRGRR